jgi:hypothetical protein
VQYTNSQREAIQTIEQFLTHRPYQAAFLLVHSHISCLQTMAHLLTTLDDRLTNLVLRWQQALRDGLDNASAQASSADERRPLQQFLDQTDDDLVIPEGLVQAANQVLRGIRTRSISAAALLDALPESGLPCTVSDLQQRFNQFISKEMRGHDSSSTPLTLNA